MTLLYRKHEDYLGIGRSLTLRLAELGAKVIAVSKTEENLKQLTAKVLYFVDCFLNIALLFGIE